MRIFSRKEKNKFVVWQGIKREIKHNNVAAELTKCGNKKYKNKIIISYNLLD